MSDALPKATHSGKLKFADVPCFVLEDGRRVISGRGMTAAIGMRGRGQGVARIATHPAIKGRLSNKLAMAIQTPIKFAGIGGRETDGFEATVLNDLCEAILTARDAEELKTEQERRYAKYADLVIRPLARVGIIALVDEATGYQANRARDALEKILDEFVAEELRKWAKTFPDEFYKQMFRLKGWPYTPWSVKRPGVVGRYTNDLVYDRLAPGVLDELRRKNPKIDGRRKHTHHQWLTEDVGDPSLREHLAAVIALMRASPKWNQFYRLVQRAFPRFNTNLELPLSEPDDE